MIGKRVRVIRNKLGMTQAKFAEPLGITGGQISAIEKGKSNASKAVILGIIQNYPVNPSFLKEGKGDPLVLGWEKKRKRQEGNTKGASIVPGEEKRKNAIKEFHERPTMKNVHLKNIVAWMDHEFGKDEERALFFYEDLKNRYESFDKFMEKKRPSTSNTVKPSQKTHRNSA